MGNGFGSGSSSSLLNCDGTCSCWVSLVVPLCGCCSVMDSLCGCCSEMDSLCDCSCEVDGLGATVLPFEVCLFLGAFFPGSYFLPLAARWSFFSATAEHPTRCLAAAAHFLIRKELFNSKYPQLLVAKDFAVVEKKIRSRKESS